MDIQTDDNGRSRCGWCGTDASYRDYHDEEWGRPTADDQRLFEKVCLEGFQCGLSWLTILRRREGFRKAFHDFDIDAVAAMTADDVKRLVLDKSIIRHRGKIEATIHNAGRAAEMRQSEGSLAAFFWSYEPAGSQPIHSHADVPAITDQSQAMSGELKRRGWKFVGPTTCYAFMQSIGIVNDHLTGCDDHGRVEQLRENFVRP
ncbi:DNA-3-methyladenine glycosylase I [Allorhodopirellula solitaria]|uniref:DNA-3-methyladenine glycosylase 1 n=1 Tax=Allorhodopirellula solitaria TaxID=2527987 RepID=A0A5C5YK94_9BACT|nr:DNA-3-methyladenine glycosylase I [Allorhodopirellula solitaria]TWT75336.1 DNA-3-methyladenine glycosylase 1 [Allorhodopirellula solitaria]